MVIGEIQLRSHLPMDTGFELGMAFGPPIGMISAGAVQRLPSAALRGNPESSA
jgi:hypothetical protein